MREAEDTSFCSVKSIDKSLNQDFSLRVSRAWRKLLSEFGNINNLPGLTERLPTLSVETQFSSSVSQRHHNVAMSRIMLSRTFAFGAY